MKITSKFNGLCNGCGTPYHVGDQIVWIKGKKGGWHTTCADTGADAPSAKPPRAAPPSPVAVAIVKLSETIQALEAITSRLATWRRDDSVIDTSLLQLKAVIENAKRR